MFRRSLLAAALGALALLAPTSAMAKGASEATITGPGLSTKIRLPGEGSVQGGRLMQIIEDAGFFPAVFQTQPNPMRSARPTADLGPRYTIEYVMPGPAGSTVIRQYVYPYATPAPVTFMEPGQPYYGNQKTLGGWYVAGLTLKDDLVAAGLSENAPADGASGADVSGTLMKASLLAAVAVGGVAVALVLAVRHLRTSPA